MIKTKNCVEMISSGNIPGNTFGLLTKLLYHNYKHTYINTPKMQKQKFGVYM